jgi:hypothetical protein
MTEQLIIILFITVGILITPLVFIALDFWAGIRKARLRGEPITSEGWRRTTYKISKYYNMLIPLMIVDIMQVAGFWYLNTYCNWSAPLFPWLTLLGAIGIGAIEIKSIYEPATAKESKELRQIAEFAQAIAVHKSDPEEIAKAIMAYMSDKAKDTADGTNN